MTARLLTVIGGGEHARVVIETAQSAPEQWVVEGFVDPSPCDETQRRLGVAWLGDDTRALARPAAERFYVLGVGSVGISDVRKRIVERYLAAGAQFATVVHARAWVSPTAQLAAGSVVLAGAIIQSGARLGEHTLVGTGAIVEHDVTFGEYVQTGPGVVLGGGVTVGAGSYLGLGACVRDHVTIGAGVLVALGAVVTANVSDGARVMGVPARAR
jgi:acetyltransferase EpsM